MSRSVDEVEKILLSLVCVLHLDGVALDCDAFFLFEVHVVKNLVLHVSCRQGLGELKKTVGQGALAVIDMCDDAEVSDVFHILQIYENFVNYKYSIFAAQDLSITMKKIITSIVLALAFHSAGFAQDTLEFLGVPIEGSVYSFCSAMRKVGFKSQARSEITLGGKYHSDKVEVRLGMDPSSEEVGVLIVDYPQKNSWMATKTLYESVRMRLTSDYGEASMTLEEYDYPYTEADGFRAVDEGKCRYITTYSIYPGGTTSKGNSPRNPFLKTEPKVDPIGEITLTISQDRRVRIYFQRATRSSE